MSISHITPCKCGVLSSSFICRFPQKHVYEVVSGVSEYKHFVPWCVDSVVLMQRNGYMEAELAVGFNVFAERYVSRVTMEPYNRVVAAAENTQLFHYLTNEWNFSPGPDPSSTWVAFSVDFQFRSILYSQASHLFFDEVVSKMVAAFERRCVVVDMERRAAARAAAHRPVIAPARGGAPVPSLLQAPTAVVVSTASSHSPAVIVSSAAIPTLPVTSSPSSSSLSSSGTAHRLDGPQAQVQASPRAALDGVAASTARGVGQTSLSAAPAAPSSVMTRPSPAVPAPIRLGPTAVSTLRSLRTHGAEGRSTQPAIGKGSSTSGPGRGRMAPPLPQKVISIW